VASLAAELEQYDRAVELYEQVASHSVDVSLLKYSVKDYLLNAGLCKLAIGVRPMTRGGTNVA
jgi:alpha-soluble NSF attachment protein